MDRLETYIGQSIYEWDLSKPDQNKMVALAKIAAALFGTNTVANGLACAATSPASMFVNLAAGEIYQAESLEATTCGTLPADTTHQIMKQGIALDQVAVPNANTGVTSFAPPGTSGQSINYLIEATYADQDVSIDPTTGAAPIVLTFFNASNPTQPFQGPNNSGSTSNTFRKGVVSLQVKAGVAATTGSQVTPTPDSGFVGLWVVSVPFGATTLTSSNISQYANAPILPSSILQSIQTDNLNYGVDVSTTPGVVQATYPLPVTALTENMNLWVRFKSANPSTMTFTPNPGVIAPSPVVGGAHAALQGGEAVANGRGNLVWRADITSWVLMESSGGSVQIAPATQSNQAAQAAQVQTGSLATAVAGGTANAITATLPATTSGTLANGQPITLIAAAANTSAVAAVITLGSTVLASLPIVKGSNLPLALGDIPSAGYPIELNFSTTFGALVMQNPATGMAGLPRDYIAGLVLSNDATNPNTQIDIAPGYAIDSTNVFAMSLGATLVKALQASGAWAAGTGNNGLFTGAIAASTWYHVFLIRNTSTGAIDAGFDTSVTAAHIPAGYAAFRRIGSILTDGSSHIRAFTQHDDEFNWTTPTLDVNLSGQGPGTALLAITIPPGVSVHAIVQGFTSSTTGSASVYLNTPGQNDVTAAPTCVTPGTSQAAAFGRTYIYSNTSQQVQINSTTAGTAYSLSAYGWADSRGKNS